MVQTGVYGSNDPAGVKAYASWVGAMPNNVLAYLNNDSWSAFDSSIGYEVSLWKYTKASSIWSVPLTVWGTSLEQVATGSYNDHFLKAAQGLAQTKPSADGNIYIRVGWEFNGSWMPWAAEGHETAFTKSFQNLVDSFHSVSDKFKFVWDVNEGDSTYNPTKAYPGDKYVDVVGMDTYYNTLWDSADPLTAFQHNVKEPYGLQWQQDFAAAHGKATAISEWGVMSDNAGPYIQAMTKWMSDHNMVFENYWDSNADYSGLLSNGQNLNAGTAYKAAVAALQAGSPAPAPVSDHILVLKVSGDSYLGDPHFIVTVDGEQVGGTLTASASHAAGKTQDITLTGRFDSGAHDIAIQFLDDAWGGSAATDRNLYIHQISVDGQVYAGGTSTNTAGSNSSGVANMLSNGSATFHMDGVSGDTPLPATSPSARGDVLSESVGTHAISGVANLDAAFLFGGAGNDTLIGGSGDDLLDGGAGADTLIGGAGYDTASYGSASSGVILDLAIGSLSTGDAAGDTFSSVEVYAGSHHNDSLRGDTGANTLLGQEGDDFLDGREGSDGLIGGDGNDFLIGGKGIDALYGGTGADTFYYRSIAESDYRETIGDFQTSVDHLQLVRAGFSDQLNLGALDANRFVVGDGPTHGFGQFIYNSAGNLFWDADGTGSGGAVSVVTLADHPTLAASDILVV